MGTHANETRHVCHALVNPIANPDGTALRQVGSLLTLPPMDIESIKGPLLGGLMIGAATGGWFLLTGKTAGCSGAIYGAFTAERGEASWKLAFLVGLALGGLGLAYFMPAALPESIHPSYLVIAAGGLLVGFGTRLAGGCTSGHGVCGIGRLSLRSIVATCTFMATAAATVLIARHMVGA